jgi:hypothetical protein
MTRTLRRLAAGAAAVGALAGAGALAAPAALAADHTQRLDIGVELVRQPPGKPWVVNLALGAELGMDDRSVPSPVRNMRFSFTSGAKVHAEAFGTCTKAIIENRGPAACPASSRLGSGKAVASVLGTTFPTDEVRVFNGPGTASSRKLLVYARAIDTVVIFLEGTLKRTSGKYGYVLDLPVEPIRAPGDEASITSFSVKVGGFGTLRGKRGVPFIEAPSSCHGAGWPFLGQFSYADGTSGTSAATIPCLLKATND